MERLRIGSDRESLCSQIRFVPVSLVSMERIARVAQHVVGERPGLAAELAELAALFRDGMLTAAEFSAAKAQLLTPSMGQQTTTMHNSTESEPVAAASAGLPHPEPDPILAVPGGINRMSDYEPNDPWLAVVHDNFKQPELWEGLVTRSGMPADLVCAAFQKEIRRGGENCENALKLTYELQTTSAGAEDKLWQRILIIAAEDVGAVCCTQIQIGSQSVAAACETESGRPGAAACLHLPQCSQSTAHTLTLMLA